MNKFTLGLSIFFFLSAGIVIYGYLTYDIASDIWFDSFAYKESLLFAASWISFGFFFLWLSLGGNKNENVVSASDKNGI